MSRALVLFALLAACGGGTTGNPSPDLANGNGCQTDNDCKGIRICVNRQCVNPPAPDFAQLPDLTGGSVDLAGGGTDLAGSNADLSGGNTDLSGGNTDLAGSSTDLSGATGGDLASGSSDLAGSGPPDLTPTVAFGMPCTGTTACTAPSGERGFCANGLGSPVCLSTCTSAPDWSICGGGNGICVPVSGTEKDCFLKCGDAGNAACGAGAACAMLGYRGANAVGVCVPACSPTIGSPDACMFSGFVCDPIRGNCLPPTCGTPACPTGTTCQSGQCNPPSPMPIYSGCTGTNHVCTSDFCAANVFGGTCTRVCDSSPAGLATCGSAGVCWTDPYSNPTTPPGDSGVLFFFGGSFRNLGGREAGLCMKGCATDADCPSTLQWHCAETNGGRACIPYPSGYNSVPAPTISAGVMLPGQPCGANTDCASGLCSIPTNFAWGICDRANTTVSCPPNTVADPGNLLLCHQSCTGNSGDECPPSEVCELNAPGITGGICAVEVCRDSSDCLFTATCDPASSKCVAAAATTGGAIGTACTVDTDCKSGGCQPQQSGPPVRWTGGYCTAQCSLLDDFTDTCPSGSLCLSRTGFAGVRGSCYALCDTPAGGASRFGSCRGGYTCTAFLSDARFGYCVTN